ncbi:hypothetical protein IW262DRAFT_325216 [Armillaria fumosa]|nr:hypothetical protein IW262DRAFT_325216 [Armillaria fumosa]
MSKPDGMEPDPNDIYSPGASYPLYAVQIPDFPKNPSASKIEWSLCLAVRIPLPPFPSLTITMSQRLCGGIREIVTRVWTAMSSNATVVVKFYDSLYFCDSYDNIDPIRFAAWSDANEVRAYNKLQFLQGTCVTRCLDLYATAFPQQEGRSACVLL